MGPSSSIRNPYEIRSKHAKEVWQELYAHRAPAGREQHRTTSVHHNVSERGMYASAGFTRVPKVRRGHEDFGGVVA